MNELLLLLPILFGCALLLPYLARKGASLGAQKYLQHIVSEKEISPPQTPQQIKKWRIATIVSGGLVGLLAVSISSNIVSIIAFLVAFSLLLIGRFLGVILVYHYVIKHPNTIQGVTYVKYPLLDVIRISVAVISYAPAIIVLGFSLGNPAAAGFFAAAVFLLFLEIGVVLYRRIRLGQ